MTSCREHDFMTRSRLHFMLTTSFHAHDIMITLKSISLCKTIINSTNIHPQFNKITFFEGQQNVIQIFVLLLAYKPYLVSVIHV